MSKNFNNNKEFVDLSKHMIITRDSCIHITHYSIDVSNMKEKFISILSNYDKGDFYVHTFNNKGFPVHIEVVNLDTSNTFIEELCISISIGFLSSIDDAYTGDHLEDNFYVYISKDYNSKLELKNL